VRAPVNGFVTNLTWLSASTPRSVPGNGADRQRLLRVEGYFEETKLPAIKPGDAVEIHMLSGGPALMGHVESISHGITDRDNPNGPELLASVNPTFGMVRLAQRIPIRIHIDEIPDTVRSARA